MTVKKIIGFSVLLFAFICLCVYGLLFFVTKVDSDVKITRNLTDEEIFRIEDEICTKSEFIVLLNDNKKIYEAVYGAEFWTAGIEGFDAETFIKNKTLDQLALYKASRLLATKKKIFLSDKEQEIAKQKSKDMQKTDASLSYAGIKAYYEDVMFFDKIYETLTAGVNSEISVDEARVINIQYIFVDKKEAGAAEKINSIYQRVTNKENPENFEKIARETNNGEYSCQLSRGITVKEFEDAAFLLATGEISPIINTEKGYYIIACINDYDKAATENNKAIILNERKNEVFDGIYTDFIKNLYYEKNDKAIEQIKF